MAGGESRWLLIGNSRWHWAQDTPDGRRYWSEPPSAGLVAQPRCWAAVGSLPQGLDPDRQLRLEQIALAGVPPWLGIDRALAGYEAWQRASGRPVLVADAGTALSLTRIDATGRFTGGRLLAGAALQLHALGRGTRDLPVGVAVEASVGDGWPHDTATAMGYGVLDGLAGALQRAAATALGEQSQLQLWLTGGDAQALLPLLLQGPLAGQPWQLVAGLCLDGLARVASLSSGPGR